MDIVDLTNLKILRLLQDDPRASYAEIARQLGIGETTAKRRVETMIELGVVAPAMIPEIYKLGFDAPAFAGILVDLEDIDRIAEELCRLPETTMVASTMGRFDIMIFIAVRSVDELHAFITTRVSTIPGIRSVETFIAPRLYKQRHDWRLSVDMLLESYEEAQNGASS